MRFSFKWLKSYVEIEANPKEIADRLTMVGLEVESVEPRYPHLKRVIPVKITRVNRHPKADRLMLCNVTDGTSTFQVVCGAPNVREGIVVPLALPGTELPNGIKVEEAIIRGEGSKGMLCSGKELALTDDASGLWILPETITLGIPLDEALGIDDFILDISVTPNRGDCLSVIGIAREVAAIYGTSVRYPDISLVEEGPPIESIARVDIEDPQKCPRYAARVIFDVEIRESPEWIRNRLESAGVRAINNIVDVTNYVMLEMGQPLHAFDYDRLADHRIIVKCAKAGDRFLTLDGQERILFDDSLMICDGREAVAIAGIMGGELSGIDFRTTRVLIESAWFDPITTRRTSKKLRLTTESSYRFERGIDPEGVIRALDRAAQLMKELGGGKISKGRIDVYPRPYQRKTIRLRVDRANKYLGTNLSTEEMASILSRLEMKVERREDGDLDVTPPSFRQDLTREVDLTEEVARIHGYDNVPLERPRVLMVDIEPNEHLQLRDALKEFLRGLGLREIITYSFISPSAISKLGFQDGDEKLRTVRLLNPLSEEQSVMRTSLVPSMLETLAFNLNRQSNCLRLFELSKIFIPKEGFLLPQEDFHLIVALVGKRHPKLLYSDEDVDYSDIKGIADAILSFFRITNISFQPLDKFETPYMDPASSADIICGESHIGRVGKLDIRVAERFDIKEPVWMLEFDYEKLFSLRGPIPKFRSLPKYPSVVRDIAMVVDESFQVQRGIDFINSIGETLLESVEIFDIFRSSQIGEGKKSIGYRLTYRSSERSLTDEEVNRIHEGIVKQMLEYFGAKLR
ncbi:MAG: phenylalanine--tRNA ligase subunit beta [Syntrophobacterales bacterium]|nr:phenylalanine--tRNA ligase subunit beta [Syntrophobacterales bacterium]